MKYTWFLPLSLLMLASCDDHLLGTTESAPCVRQPPLTYENFGLPIIEKNCAGCHSSLHAGIDRSNAPVGVDFDTWDGILLWADRIHVRTYEDLTMPPTGGLTEVELDDFDEWMRCEVFPNAERF